MNIGDTIIESSTATPVAPEGVCAAVAPAPPATIVERQYVIVQPPPPDMSDANADEARRVDSDLAGLPFVAVGVASVTPPFHSHPHGAPRGQTSVGRPSMSTVLLPPFPTVLLPPGSAPQHIR